MIERLEVDDVLEINGAMCADTGENSVCLDAAGLEAAVERPWAGFGEEQFYPSFYDKAAALMHGIASRQVFENGNKRTAWAAAVAFLDINGIDIGHVEPVQSDMFVRAAALDHTLEVAELAEWFEVAHRRPAERGTGRAGLVIDPRVEYFIPGKRIDTLDTWGTFNAREMQIAGTALTRLPLSYNLAVLARVRWTLDDVGQEQVFHVDIAQDDRIAVFQSGTATRVQAHTPARLGPHPHFPDGVYPGLISLNFGLTFFKPGHIEIVGYLNDSPIGRLPFEVRLAEEAPSDPSALL